MLVVIGLIIGGILVGQDLIKVAQIRGAVSDLEKVSTSVNAFKLKYECVPGDCAVTSTFFAASTFIYSGCPVNGDGNGLIDVWTCESARAIASLAAAGLMPYKMGPASGNSVANTLYFGTFVNSNAYFYSTDLYGATNKIGNTVTWSNYSGWFGHGGAMTPGQASDIDKKIDDGFPMTGAFIGADSSPPTSVGGTGPGVGVVVGASCVTAGANTYASTVGMGCRTIYFLQ